MKLFSEKTFIKIKRLIDDDVNKISFTDGENYIKLLKKMYMNTFLHSLLYGFAVVFAIFSIFFFLFNQEESFFMLLGVVSAIFAIILLFFALSNNYLIRKYKENKQELDKIIEILETYINSLKNKVYLKLNEKECENISDIVFTHLTLKLNIPEDMAKRIKESVYKKLIRFVFRDRYH